MKLLHRHKWRTTGVDQRRILTPQEVKVEIAQNNNKGLGNLFSLIHQQCKICGQVQTIKRTGHYTLKELTNKS